MINVWDYRSELSEERAEIDAAISGVLESGRLILGESVSKFEDAFARFCGVRRGVGVNSGTDAVFLALKAAGIQEGDEVLTVANTAVPTVCAISAAGGVARFVDVDPRTYLMDVSKLEGAVTARTRFIVPVHLYGQCVDMSAVRQIAESRGLKVVEDCAQAHGATQGGKTAGSMSDAAAFSFYPTKVLGAYGDGGMVVTDDDSVSSALRRLRYYGMEDRYYAVELGYNSRLDELQAAILLFKLSRIRSYIERRRSRAELYNRLLSDSDVVLPEIASGNDHVYYVFVCRHPERDRIIEGLRARDIHINVSYRWPIHTMKGYVQLGYKGGELPVTERVAEEIFSLPMYPTLSDQQVEIVCASLREVLRQL